MDVEKIVREYIDKTVHMSLATTAGGKPWVCEVHFAYDEDLNLYFRSSNSRRHSLEIAQNPNVAGNIVRQHALEESPKGVYFEGIAEHLAAGDEQNQAYKCINERLHAGDDILEQAQNPEGAQFYKITVKNFYVFGAFDDADMAKYQLPWVNN
jgi:uncharacterized protein YhbP (UPF0306 family)